MQGEAASRLNLLYSSIVKRILQIVTALLLASCAAEPEKVSSPNLIGSWKSDFDSTTLTCEDTGLFTLTFTGPKTRPIVGDYTFDGKILTFRNRPETKLCVDETGVYEIKIDGSLLIARKVKDFCPLREKQMDHSWTRVKAAGVGSSAVSATEK
jgi:hypothetical protein